MSSDHELEKYLGGKSDLSGLYAEQPEVVLPKHLDAAILAEAHRAVGSRPGAKPVRRWTIPLGMVATLFVVVMVGLQLPYMLQDAGQQPRIKEEIFAARIEKNLMEPAPNVSVEQRKTGAMHENTSALRMKAQATAAAKPDASGLPEMKAIVLPLESKSALQLPSAAPAPVAKNTQGMSDTREVAASEARSADAASFSATPSADVSSQKTGIPAKRMQLRESSGLLGGSLSKEKKDAGQGGSVGRDSLEKSVATPGSKLMAAPVVQDTEPKESLKKEAGNIMLEPEEWIKRIRKFKQDGQEEDYKRELAEFKKRYPNFLLPRDIDSR